MKKSRDNRTWLGTKLEMFSCIQFTGNFFNITLLVPTLGGIFMLINK